MFKFYGKRGQVINSINGGIAFRFDNKGEFITDDDSLIERAKERFDHAEIKVESISVKVIVEKKDYGIKITQNEKEPEPEGKFKCKKCDFSTDNQGLLMRHYKTEHKKE